MNPDKIVNNVYRLPATVCCKELFEGIWPIPNGVMINSYLVKGSNKTVLIDYVKDWDGAKALVDSELDQLKIEENDIDYFVVNHMEPDHTGAIVDIVKKNPNAKILCSKKAVPLIEAFYGIKENIHVVEDGETLDLGEKTLQFFMTPNVHWPETMMTYLIEDKILFSCDAFGAYGIYKNSFDDQLTEKEWALLLPETERYFANIISSFSAFCEKAIKKLESVDVSIICPSHGIMWRKNPEKAIGLYSKLASYAKGKREKEITIVWSSMYGNTKAILDSFIDGVESVPGVKCYVFQVPQTHESFILEKAWRSEGLIVGMPTYEYKMFPPMYTVLDQMDRSHITNRKIARFGSYGWSGGALKQFLPFVESMKLDFLGEVEYQGYPSDEDKKKAFDLAARMAKEILEEK
ncbi:MAG: FprA family A-type flavoprotein [Spirochaetia bacterium]|nr:FprA family A-type flavoprotein [Spirochaetia bacterium]